MQFHHPAEVISFDHRVVANVEIIHFDEENKFLYTLIPRSLTGAPVPFPNNEVYNLVYTSYERIHFFNIRFILICRDASTQILKSNQLSIFHNGIKAASSTTVS